MLLMVFMDTLYFNCFFSYVLCIAMTSWIFDWKKDEKKFNRVHNKDLFVELDSLCSQCKTRPLFVGLFVFLLFWMNLILFKF